MGLATYAIVSVGGRWGILHDGNVEGDHVTKESAFEAAIAPLRSRSAKGMRSMSACRAAMKVIGQRPVQITEFAGDKKARIVRSSKLEWPDYATSPGRTSSIV
jgi:hypothetical protein